MKLDTVTHSAKISSSIGWKRTLRETRTASYMCLKHRNKTISQWVNKSAPLRIQDLSCCGGHNSSDSLYFNLASFINNVSITFYKCLKVQLNMYFATIKVYQSQVSQQIHKRTMNECISAACKRMTNPFTSSNMLLEWCVTSQCHQLTDRTSFDVNGEIVTPSRKTVFR